MHARTYFGNAHGHGRAARAARGRAVLHTQSQPTLFWWMPESAPAEGAGPDKEKPQLNDAAAREALKNFAAMDSDGDGQLSAEEFRTGLGMLGMDQDFAHILFSSFDTDRSGTINKSEFLAAMAVMLHPTDMEQQVSMAFDAYDLNRDGRLSLEELEHVISAMFGTMVKMGIRDEVAEPTAIAAATELYRQLDCEGKGHVNKEDYLRLATTNPEMLKRLGLGNRLGRGGSRLRTSMVDRAPPTPGQPQGSLYGVPPPASQRPRRRGRGTGMTVAFGHDNWELVVQMMLAIRLSVGRAMKLAQEAGRKSDDDATSDDVKAPVSPPIVNGNMQPSSDDTTHPMDPSMFQDTWNTRIPGKRHGKETSIDFKDYAPLVFRRVRSLFGISDRDYMLSLGPEQILGELLLGTMGSLAELFSEGKSRSFFYFSNDGRYLIKTIPHRELLSLINILPQYLAHVEAEPFTLLPRFMGAHRIRMPGSRKNKVHFVVMTNVFSSSRVIHERYDLKGSTHGRTAGADNLRAFPDLVRKDLDLIEPFHIKSDARDSMCTQISSDLQFLREVGTMDYSLLCGVHYPQRENPSVAPADVSLMLGSAPSPGLSGASASGLAPQPLAGRPPSHIMSQSSDAVAVHSPENELHSDAPTFEPAAGVGAARDSTGSEIMPSGSLRSMSPDVSLPPTLTLHARAGMRAGNPPSLCCAPILASASTLTLQCIAAENDARHRRWPSLASQALLDGSPAASSPPSPPPGDSISGRYSSSRAGARAPIIHRDQNGKAPSIMPPWCDYADGAMVASRPSQQHQGEQSVYFIGIIDILTGWTCAKAAENAIKTATHPSTPNSHSCVPPVRYADRFEAALPSWVDDG